MGYPYLAGPWPGSGANANGSSGGTSTSSNGGANSSATAATPTPRLGPQLVKTLYVEYTDANFTAAKPRLPGDAYQGFMGPLLRANVGDTIKVGNGVGHGVGQEAARRSRGCLWARVDSGSGLLHTHRMLASTGRACTVLS